MYKLVKSDGTVYQEFTKQYGWVCKQYPSKGFASKKMHDLDDEWFIVPFDWVYRNNLGAGKTWDSPGQRG